MKCFKCARFFVSYFDKQVFRAPQTHEVVGVLLLRVPLHATEKVTQDWCVECLNGALHEAEIYNDYDSPRDF